MSFRIEKVNKLIKQQISEIISRELSLKPGVFVTVSKVDTAKDLRYTRILVSIFPESETDYAMKTLEKELYIIQGQLNKKLFMKPIPKIEFAIDSTEVQADNLEKIFKEIKEEK